MESKRINKPGRYKICQSRDIAGPGDYFLSDTLAQPLIIIRGEDDKIRAFHNVCRHREARLLHDVNSKGIGHCPLGLMRCPYHAWVYDWRGQLDYTPLQEIFPDFNKNGWHLHEVAVEVVQGYVYVLFDQDFERS